MFTLLKLFFSNAVPFIIARWRVFLCIAILCITYYYKARGDSIAHEFNAYKTEQANQIALAQQAIILTRAIADKNLADSEAKAAADIKRLKLDRNKITQDLENEKDNIANLLNDAYSYRVSNAGSNCALPKTPTDTERPSESERDGNATIAIIEACKLTTIDYNRLRAWADEACLIAGCE
jgi:hypothetical protein